MNKFIHARLRFFNELFKNEKQILFVFGIVYNTDYKKRTKNPYKAYKEIKKYVHNIETFKIQKRIYNQEDLEYYYAYGICNVSEIDTKNLIKRCGNYHCNYNPNLVPHFDYHKKYGIDVYFINPSNHLIFHIYDDHVCDVLATSYEDLKPVYNKFREWAYSHSTLNL